MVTNSYSNLAQLVDIALPALSGSGVTYNSSQNIFLTQGYTSQAGNTYFQGIRLSNRLIISYELGQGYAHLFLNGIRLYGYNGRKSRLLATREFNSFFFDEYAAEKCCVRMLKEYLQSQSKLAGVCLPDWQISEFSSKLIAEAITNNHQLTSN